MKQFRLTDVLFLAAMVFILTSCGGSDEKTTTDSTTGDTTNKASTEVTPEVNTIVTTPQAMMIARHKVADYEKWKASYDAHDSFRLANGIHSYVIGRGVEDPNMVQVAVKVDDLAKAKAFAKDPSLKKAMQKGGVTGAPTITFNTMVWQDTGTISAPFRSRTSFKVKDWETWRKSFDSGKQERLDNGITDRAIGHDPDDDKKVVVVTAFSDSARARAYWNSDALKKRREAGGVIGTPDRFVFTVAQRY